MKKRARPAKGGQPVKGKKKKRNPTVYYGRPVEMRRK